MRLTQIALGHDYVCGLNEGARAVCIEDLRGLTFQPASLSSISAGKFFFCGLGYGGAVSCWGHSPYGEASPPPGAFSSVSAGKRHACALDADGKAVCWGWERTGRATPPADARFIAVAAGGAHSCGIAEFGNLICWGNDELGRSDPREGPFSALALGLDHTCALNADGRAFCQGGDGYGQSSPPPTVFSSIAAGESQTCGLTPQGGLECWGLMSISGYPDKFASVSVGYREICALTVGGAVKCWVNSPPGEDPINGVLYYPIEMFPMPFGGVAVADRRGHISIHPAEGGEPRIALDLKERTKFVEYHESGLLSAALDPDFDQFPFIYIYWHTNEGVVDKIYDPFEARVSRFPVADDGSVSADDELVILRLPHKGSGHFGGALRFGADGMMYLSLGDLDVGGDLAFDFDELHPSADLSTLAGKIIRIDVRGATEGAPYRAPPDNPFADTPGARPEIWAYGLRNPWRMSFAPGGDLIVADVGYGSREEVSIVSRGANLGWPLFEGGMCFAADKRLCEDLEGYTFPIFEYTHEDGDCAIIGGMSAPDGGYIFGDYCSGRIWALERTAPGVWEASEITAALGGVYRLGNVIAFGSDADGAVYALKQRAPVWRVTE